jgi:hypothetical protein
MDAMLWLGESMNPPSKPDVVVMFQRLIDETITREEAANWAEPWIIAYDPPRMPQEIWKALIFLSGVDLPTTDRPYLHGKEDFEAALDRLDV